MKIKEFISYNSPIPLFEVLDNPYPISDSTPIVAKITDALRKTYNKKISGLHVYERIDVDAPNYHRDVFIMFRYNGLWEIHHSNYDDPKNPISGEIILTNNAPNPRFIATMIKLYLSKIGKGIRIVANEKMMESYIAIISRYIKRTGDQYSISDVNENYIGLDGKKRHSIVIKPTSKGFVPSI